MKKLIAPATVVIPSNLPRTRRGPDSRGFRICVAEIGRSCVLQQGFITFTDGSAYSYDAPSLDEFVALCASLQRGKQFNSQVRRAASGYIKGFTPPPDYEAIYDYPPYPGSTPAACPLPGADWAMTDWTVTTNSPGTGQVYTFTPTGGINLTFELQVVTSVALVIGHAVWNGILTYNGPSFNGQLRVVTSGPNGQFDFFSTVTISQDGTLLASGGDGGSISGTFLIPFTVADTLGVDSTLRIDVDTTPDTENVPTVPSYVISGENV